MILTNFKDIVVPTEIIWSHLNYRNLEAKNKINFLIQNKKLIHEHDNDIDTFILNAINYYENLDCIVLFGKDKTESFKYHTTHLKKHTLLYGIKHMHLKTSLVIKIMYQLLFTRTQIKKKEDLLDYIKENIEYIHRLKELNIPSIDVTVLFLCKKTLTYKCYDVLDPEYYIYTPSCRESLSICSSLFYCESSIKFMKVQNITNYMNFISAQQSEIEHEKRNKSFEMFSNYRRWIYDNIDYINRQQFILYSSVILYLLGNREMNDLDLYVHTVPDEDYFKLIEYKTNNTFVDFRVKNRENWPHYWDTWLDEWAIKCKAKYFEEIIGNSNYYFYFLGVKIISLDCDIVRRIERYRPRAYADLISLRKKYSYPIHIPPIPKQLSKFESIADLTKEEIEEKIGQGAILNEKNNEIKVMYDTNIDKFIGTILYSLKERYGIILTQEDIYRELNMPLKKVTIKRVSSAKNK
jgi:imidazoleglycerol phosphate synthase glutamine amidotransferase subunit HisH